MVVNEQHINTGDYIITYYNKYGSRLRDLTESAPCLQQARDTANRRLFDPDDISKQDSHHLPTAFTIDRRIDNSEQKK
jgi:hypothetical protein